jgi:ABC-2 type transport system permease protein
LLKGFGNFLVKELKELVRDPKILLGMIVLPLIMFPVIGGIMTFSIQSAQEQAAKAGLLVLNNDGGIWAEIFIGNLSGFAKVFVVNNTSPQMAVTQGLMAEFNTTQFIEIPQGFSENITMHMQGNSSIVGYINSYSTFSGTSVFESVGSSVISDLVYRFNRQVAPDVVGAETSVIIKGKIENGVDPSILSSLMLSQAIALPITIMILLTYSMQIAATSVAMEKEEKTLETLLTLPMDRLAILMGKLSSSICVAGVGALAYMVGYTFMLGSFTATIPVGTSIDLASLGLVPSLFGYLLLGISLFVTLLSALALAVIMSAFSEDVRGAQSLVGYIYPLIFIPSFALMYLDVNTLPLPLKILMYAIPYSHPIIASKAIIVGDYMTVVLGIVYVTAFTVIVLYAASRLFATEKILTAKLKFRGLRGLRKREKTQTEDFQ